MGTIAESLTPDSGVQDGVVCGSSPNGQKLIIDTDPGVDDSMTILMAFQTQELHIIGLTTVFGNVSAEDATRNALLLCEIAGRPDVPVAKGSPVPLKVVQLILLLMLKA
uniref:Inosine/uridine-preferring nucleoside hydrolase domain-containing protein n=1 Tax=Opuntia streptacantha TaxID=393608 RepID=A0A7C8YVL9_OPUST